MSERTYERLADLELTIDSVELSGRQLQVPSGFARETTIVRLRGGGEEGLGEDVTYTPADHEPFRQGMDRSALEGRHSLSGFSELLDRVSLWPQEPQHAASRDYRRWAFESAALDLALRQARRSLADLLGRESRPVTFVLSMGLGQPARIDPVLRRLERFPGTRFKLDANPTWDDRLIGRLAEIAVVDVIDLKGAYHGTPVDQGGDPALYRRLLEGLPGVWIEDPAMTDETLPVLLPHIERVTWDAPIHGIADIEGLAHRPRTLNFKPSRFGRISELLDAYDYCQRQETILYGGGQFELDVGRGQIQYLASLFHPEGPNDVAPVGYHVSDPAEDSPRSPLAPSPAPYGFRWTGAGNVLS